MNLDPNRSLRFPRTLHEAGWSSMRSLWRGPSEIPRWKIACVFVAGMFASYLFLVLVLGWSPG